LTTAPWLDFSAAAAGLPQVFGYHIERRWRYDATRCRRPGVVDEKIKPAEILDGRLDHRLRFDGDRDVTGGFDRLPAVSLKSLDAFPAAAVAGEKIESYAGTGLGQNRCGREADTGRRAGDDRGFAPQIVADHSPPADV